MGEEYKNLTWSLIEAVNSTAKAPAMNSSVNLHTTYGIQE